MYSRKKYTIIFITIFIVNFILFANIFPVKSYSSSMHKYVIFIISLMISYAENYYYIRKKVNKFYRKISELCNQNNCNAAIDLLNNAINNLDVTASLIDTTLEDITILKAKYKKDFSKYEHSFSGYRDAIKKLNKMENAILGSKIKISSLQIKMKEKEKKNKNKLMMVKKLNDSSNNSKKIA